MSVATQKSIAGKGDTPGRAGAGQAGREYQTGVVSQLK